MKKIFKNIGWLIFDKIFILLLQFLVGVKIANYYGSVLYGSYSYLVSIIAFSYIFFELINGRIPKKYYNEQNYNKIVFNITIFRNTIAIIIFVISIFIKNFIKMDFNSYIMLVFLALDNVLITSTLGIENYYEYKLESKKIVISNNVVKVISYGLQYLGILLHYPIIMIPAVRCIGSFVRMCLLKLSYHKNYGQKTKKEIDKKLIKNLIQESFYLWISFVSVLIYTQLDKIMLGMMLGKKEVGIYTIGVLLSQILEIIITPIQTSIYPEMLKLYRKDYKKYINFYFKSNFIITQIYLWGILLSIVLLKLLFKYVFSSDYNQSIKVYSILTITILMKANGAFQTSHMALKNITKKSFYKTLLGLFVNIVLNYLLISRYGILGAAIATSITQTTVILIFDFFIKEYKEHAWIQLKSFNPLYFFKILGKQN